MNNLVMQNFGGELIELSPQEFSTVSMKRWLSQPRCSGFGEFSNERVRRAWARYVVLSGCGKNLKVSWTVKRKLWMFETLQKLGII